MTESALQRVLAHSTEEVLEQMFFVRALNEPLPGSSGQDTELVALVAFEGEPSGRLTLRVSEGAARSIAADFLGEDESTLSERQVGEVICELANIICGSVLSSVESETTFHLKTPRLLGPDENPGGAIEAEHSIVLDRGVLGVAFCAEGPICQPAA